MPPDTDPSRSLPGGSCIAVCLAGGGFPGAIFEFGALAALEDGLSGWRPADSVIIVGTSCGAVVGAAVALGMTSADVRDAVDGVTPHPLSLAQRDFSRVPWRAHLKGLGRILMRLPRLLTPSPTRSRWERIQDEARTYLPAGMFSNAGLGDLLSRIRSRARRGDRFEDLLVPLAVTATALDSGDRVVFGAGGDAHPPVSLAVRASAAIPGFFSPVRIADRDYIDGQIFDPIHLDLGAVPEARVLLGITPLSPYVLEDEPGTGKRVTSLGMAGVFEQSARISARIKQTASLQRLARVHPDLLCCLVEPRPAEVMRLMQAGFGKRDVREAWELGYGAASRMLRSEAERLAARLAPAGIRVEPPPATPPSS